MRYNIWRIKTEMKPLHPAPFPEVLVEGHVLSWSNPGDVVYDPFMGSGTTAYVARLLDRNYLGSEISKEYCEIIEKRLSDAV
jgi:site-specific DNA-methyltransferase (adenine-specific)